MTRDPEPSFLCDRMLGTLCRYLRMMGYDTESAASMFEGNRREDTILLLRADQENRILLTKDRELARRGRERTILMYGDDVMAQVRQLAAPGLIVPVLRMNRCPLCNGLLRPASSSQIRAAEYAPGNLQRDAFMWCRMCRRLYWTGSHGRNLQERIDAAGF